MNYIKKIIIKFAIGRIAKLKGVAGMLAKLKKYFEQKKSVAVIVAMVVMAVVDQIAANNFGISIPREIWVFMFGLLGITVKAGQNRVENSTKELIAAIKEQNDLIKKKK